MLGDRSKGKNHGGHKHDELDGDDDVVALSLADGEVDEKWRSPKDVEVGFGAVMVGEKPQEDNEHRHKERKREYYGVKPT